MNFPTNLPRTKKLNIKKNLRLGKKIRLNGLDMFIRENKDISSYKPGVIISKKISNKAVVRNKYKRIIREVFRLDFKDLTSKEILTYYLYTIPLFINIAFPMSILIATIYTIGSLQKNNEITAIKASGISIRRIGLPIILLGIIFCCLSFYFENIIVVKSIQKRFAIEKKLKPHDSKYIKNRKTNIFYHLDDSFLEIKKFNYKNDTGYNISLQKYDGSDLIYRIDAKKMIWQTDSNSWNLINGSIREWKNDEFDY